MRYATILLAVAYVLAAPVDEEDAVEEFINGNHVFTAAIYKEVVKQDSGNLIVSPFSAETVLALTLEGALGDTASELITGLSLPHSLETTEKAYLSLLPRLRTSTKDSLQLSIANKIYVENGVLLEDTFRSKAVNVYGSGVENVAFEDSLDTAAEINNWVEEQTNHKIKDLVSPDSLQPDTVMILINTLYLKGEWASPFTSRPVVKKQFYTTKDLSVQVDTMHNEANYLYYENRDLNAKFLELPIKGGDISMVVILPNEVDGLASLEQNIDQVLAPQPFTQEKVIVDLPSFTIESKIDFVPVLKKLGIQRIFGPAADLNGLSSNDKNLYVSGVIQKAFINVTQGGVEAAAATEVEIVKSMQHDATVEYKADHPFLYYIRDNGVLIFFGRYINPNYT